MNDRHLKVYPHCVERAEDAVAACGGLCCEQPFHRTGLSQCGGECQQRESHAAGLHLHKSVMVQVFIIVTGW